MGIQFKADSSVALLLYSGHEVKADTFLDLLLFSGHEVSDEELKTGLNKNYYCIDPEQDFQDYKQSYLKYKVTLQKEWDTNRFLKEVKSHLDQLAHSYVPSQTRGLVLYKLKQLTLLDDKICGIFQKRKARGLIQKIETDGECVEQFKRCIDFCGDGHFLEPAKYILRKEIGKKISLLNDEQFCSFLTDVFFKHIRSCAISDCKKKLRFYLDLSIERQKDLINELMKRDDWYIQLFDLINFPGSHGGANELNARRHLVEEHSKIIAELPEEAFIEAFSRDLHAMIDYVQEPVETYDEAMHLQRFRKRNIRLMIEKALHVHLRDGNSAALTELINTLDRNGWLPQTVNEVRENTLALIFERNLLLEDYELKILKEILPKELYKISILEWD